MGIFDKKPLQGTIEKKTGQMSNYLTMMAFKDLGEYLGRKLDEISNKLNAKPKENNSLTQTSFMLMETAKSIKNLKVDNSDIKVSIKEMADAIKENTKAIKSLSINVEVPTPVINIPEKDDKETLEVLKEIRDKEVEKEQYPEKFSIDNEQFQNLTGTIRASAAHTLANKATIYNLSMATANTEYSYTFPSNTVSWTLRVRDTDVPILYAWDTGVLPTSGDGSAYATVPAYYLQSQDGVEWSNRTIYLQTGSANQVCEIISYQF